MKIDAHEQVVKLVPALAGTGIALADISTIVTIIVGICTAAYVIIQMAFLLRKWWLLEMADKPPRWEETKR